VSRRALRAALSAALSCAATVVAVASVAHAQPASRCRIDTTADWYRAQRRWLQDAPGSWSDDAFRTMLTQAAGVDAAHPLALQLGYELAGASASVAARDSAAIARLKALAAQRGSTWPTRTVVGAAGVRAVWLLSGRDTTLTPTILHRLMEAGPEESSPADVATLEDRQRLRAGRKQIYATQMRVVNGKVEPYPTEDLAHVDLRRDGAQLPPFAVSLCLAREARR
jgi:hypothetical protein